MKRFRLNQIMAALAVSAVLFNQNGIYTLAEETAQMVEAEGESAALSAEMQQPETEVKTEAPTEAPTPAPTEAPTEAPTPAPTEAPTEAPTPAPTEAPTEAPTPAPTEAPTEAPTPAPTEAPTEASTSEPTEAPTEAPTPASTEAPAETPTEPATTAPEVLETESQVAETETETEAKTEIPLLEMDTEDETLSSLNAQAGDALVTLKLPEGQEVGEDAKLIVKEITASEGDVYNKALSLVKEKTEKGHRQLADIIAYRIEIEEDGKTSFPEGTVTLSFAWSKPIDLGLLPWMQGEALIFRLGGEAEEIGEISLASDKNDERSFTGFEISGKQLSLIAAAGVQNRVPTGKKLEKSELLRTLEDLTDYSVVANRFEGGSELPEGLLAGEIAGQETENIEETTKSADAEVPEETTNAPEAGAVETEDAAKTNSAEEDTADAGKLLEAAVEKSLSLANSSSSGNVTFVTVYADEEGKIDDEPLGAVLVVSDTGKEYLNVTDTMLVINIVAAKPDQKLTLPDWQLINTDSSEGAHVEGTAGKVLYNLVAQDGSGVKPFAGTLTVKDEIEGTILAPKAKVDVQKSMAGAVYVDQASLENEAQIESVTLGAVYQEAQAEEEKLLEAQQELKTADPEPVMGEGEEDNQKEGTLIRIEVKAVLDGAKPKALPEDVVFKITDEEGNDLVDAVEDHPLPERTIPADQGTTTFNIDTSRYDLFKQGGTVRLKIRLTSGPVSYRIAGSEPEDAIVTVTITPGEGETPASVSAEPQEVTFRYAKINTAVALNVMARQANDKTKALPSGTKAVYVIQDSEGNRLKKNGSDNPYQIIAENGKDASAVFNANDYELLSAIKPGEEKEFFVEQMSVTSPWQVQGTPKSFIVGRDNDGAFYIAAGAGETHHAGESDPLGLTFLYEKIPEGNTKIALTISAKQIISDTALPEGTKAAYEIQDSNGKPLKKNGSESAEVFTVKDGADLKTVFNANDYALISGIESGKKKTFKIVQKSVTSPWQAQNKEQTFVIGRKSDGSWYIAAKDGDTAHSGEADPLNVSFSYYDPYVELKIRALQKSSGKAMPSGTVMKYELRRENGEVIKIKDSSVITLNGGKAATLKINTSTTSLFKELKPKEQLKLVLANTEWPYGWMPEKTAFSVIVFRAEDGSIRVYEEDTSGAEHAGTGDPLELSFKYAGETVKFNVAELDEKTKKIALAGGAIAVRLPDGSALTLTAGTQKGTSVKVDDKAGITVGIPLTDNKAFAELLEKNGKVNLTVVALTAPTDPAGYTFSTKSGTEYPLTITKKDAQTQAAASPKTVNLLFKKGSATLTSDSVQVVKYLYFGESTGIFPSGKQNYYVALFKDKKLTQRVTDVKTIAFKGSSLTASTVFNHLEPGKYYVGETDETGRLVGLEKDAKKAKAKNQLYYVEYSTQEVTVNGITNKTIRVNMCNHYFDMPKKGLEYYAVVKVTKKVVDSDKKAKKSNGTFYFRVNEDKKNIRRINMNGQDSASINVYVRMPETTKDIRITEVKPRVKNGAYVKDSSGNYVFDEMTSNDVWDISYQNRSVTLRQGQTETPEVVITNREINKKETESETGKKKESETAAGADTAVITVVKKATYRGNPIRLNSTFYIGIFEDAALKKPRANPMKMTLKDLSEKSREIKVNLYILPKNKRSVTMYFAETDSKGNPLTSGKNGYTITPSGAVKVTVDPQHPKATVTFTNNIEAGSRLEETLRDGSSGLAGDATAIEDSYRGIGGTADGGSGSGTSAKTGDETPLALWLGTLLLGLLTAWLMFRKLSCQQDEKTL